jgi:hypothetical protein
MQVLNVGKARTNACITCTTLYAFRHVPYELNICPDALESLSLRTATSSVLQVSSTILKKRMRAQTYSTPCSVKKSVSHRKLIATMRSTYGFWRSVSGLDALSVLFSVARMHQQI